MSDLSGKKVAIIGNGSSGAQITPFLAAHAEHLTIYQRTPQWMSPRPDYLDTISEAQQWLLTNLPYYWNWYVYGQFVNQIGLQKAQEFDGTDRADGHVNQWNDALWKTLTEYIHQKVGDDPAADEAGRARDQDPHAPDARPPVPSATARRDSSPSASATSRSTSDDVIGSTESDR